MRKGKSRSIITAEEVPVIFDDARVRDLAKTAKLPPSANMAAFAAGVRDAAWIFARDARIPTCNDLHAEIAELLKAAGARDYDHAAALLENLSHSARGLLKDRGARPSIAIELPTPDAMRDPGRRERGCDAIARLCQVGGEYVDGRRRPSGKRSRPAWHALLHAPEAQRNFPKRKVERQFVIWLSVAWLDATGQEPSRTARHRDDGNLGPFASFVRECLRLVGAQDADAVGLINDLHKRRRDMEQSRQA